MKRTQIQLPDALYEEVRRVARLHEWSIAEVLRRSAEQFVRRYPTSLEDVEGWRMPKGTVGGFRSAPELWRELAWSREDPGSS